MKLCNLILCATLISPLLVACTSTNSPALARLTPDTSQQEIQIKKTTKDDIRKIFGDAKEIRFEENGVEIWVYKDYNASAAAANHVLQYVPFLTSSDRGAELISEETKKELVILFDETGVVKKYRIWEKHV
jgi:hypothetical protein